MKNFIALFARDQKESKKNFSIFAKIIKRNNNVKQWTTQSFRAKAKPELNVQTCIKNNVLLSSFLNTRKF